MQSQTIEKAVYLPIGKEEVWAYLTQSKKLNEWFHPSQEDLQEGQDYLLTSQKDGDRMCWGKVEEMSPHDYMRWSFTVGPANGEMSMVEWRLDTAPGGTRLKLSHSGLSGSSEGFGLVLALDKGWHGFLSTLREKSDALALALSKSAA